jgi:hypothetical protein
MPFILDLNAWCELPTSFEVEGRIAVILSDKKVRPVVTRGGHRARGRFPSIRFSQTRYESLVEEDALRIMEVASFVHSCTSHPYVLDLIDPETGRHFRYTPDVAIRADHTTFLVEVKGDWLLKLPKPRMSLLRICRSLKTCGVPFAVLSETDASVRGLQDRLKLLLKRRPIGTRRMSGVDKTAWDPLGHSTPTAEDLRLWREAQEECNALLRRVMGRDPEDFVECFDR